MVRRILVIVAAVIALLLVAFVGLVAMQPAEFSIARSAAMDAPPAEVFDQVNELQKWNAWSPWAKLDPNAKNSFDGPASGEGATFHWSGNDEIGEGRMTITESRPNQLIRMKLAFVRPMEDTADTEFQFEAAGEGTKVTWTMSGEKNFMGKLVCLFMDMDAMLGGSFEEGLASMKAVVEAKHASSVGESPGDPAVGEPSSAAGAPSTDTRASTEP